MNAPVTQLQIDQRIQARYVTYPSPDGLFPVGGYRGNDDDGRSLQAGLARAGCAPTC